MTTQRPAAGRRLHRAVSLAAALLLASLPLAAQNRSRPSGSGDTGRTAHGTGSSRPSYSPPPSSSGGSDRSSASSQPRTARPSDGSREPHRQPPSRGDRGDRNDHGRGGHGGHYYYGGGYYPYHYPYGWGNYGFWPGFYGWWWWGYPSYGYGNYPGGYYDYGRDRAGALDFDVAPARAEIYLDGQYVGKVDGFDGWPRYLWLPKGTYDVVLYLDGYKTIARQISVYPGSVIQIDDRMEPGDSVRPEDLVSKSTERRDERMRYERERRDRLDRDQREGERGDDYDEDWRDRVRRDRVRMRDDDRDDDRDVDVDEEDVRGSREKGRLVLDVEPEDASVYLDGRFVGTGSELALMRDGLPVTPGEHRLAIVRPGRKAEEREFDVEAGEEVEIEVELETESR